MSFQCCGRPRLSALESLNFAKKRQEYLQANGPQSAAEFDYIYGYGTSNACGRNISYYQQFEASNGEHCNFPHYADREEQIDQYRGLNCRRLRGWDKRMQHPIVAGCCSYPGSCNGTLPYPYAQVQSFGCNAETQQYAMPSGYQNRESDYTWALDEPKQYPHTPYPESYYMQTQWPYGETEPTLAQVVAIADQQKCR